MCADCGAACPSTQWCCDACIREHNAECQRLGGFKHLGNGFEDDHGEDSYFESQMASGERDRWGRR